MVRLLAERAGRRRQSCSAPVPVERVIRMASTPYTYLLPTLPTPREMRATLPTSVFINVLGTLGLYLCGTQNERSGFVASSGFSMFGIAYVEEVSQL